jgi:hypothetical protein
MGDTGLGFTEIAGVGSDIIGLEHEVGVGADLEGFTDFPEFGDIILDSGSFVIGIEPLGEDIIDFVSELDQAIDSHEEAAQKSGIELVGSRHPVSAEGFKMKEEVLPGHGQVTDVVEVADTVANKVGVGIVEER